MKSHGSNENCYESKLYTNTISYGMKKKKKKRNSVPLTRDFTKHTTIKVL